MQNEYKIYYTREARLELFSLHRYVIKSGGSEKTANNLIIELNDAISYAKNDPYLYPEVGDEGFRKCVIKNYILY